MTTGYIVYRQNAESYQSMPELPKAVFTDENKATEFAKKQPGYGLGIDWFVKPIAINPEV